MKLPEAIHEILDTTSLTKYRLAKLLGVNSISIDNFMNGRQKTVNKAIANNLEANFYMKLDKSEINEEEPRASHKRHEDQGKLL